MCEVVRPTSTILLAARALTDGTSPDSNAGTGTKCISAADGVGGPKCPGQQVGVCYTESHTQQECLTLFGPGPEPTVDATCAHPGHLNVAPESLSPFCCDELDLPDCSDAALETKGDVVEPGQTCVVCMYDCHHRVCNDKPLTLLLWSETTQHFLRRAEAKYASQATPPN